MYSRNSNNCFSVHFSLTEEKMKKELKNGLSKNAYMKKKAKAELFQQFVKDNKSKQMHEYMDSVSEGKSLKLPY